MDTVFQNFQLWFEPLLWAIGTVGAIVGFIKLCLPAIKRLFLVPGQVLTAFQALEGKVTTMNEEINLRLDSFEEGLEHLKEHSRAVDEIQIKLLGDRIIQGYYLCMEKGDVPDDVYHALCDMHALYKTGGGNSYVDSVMDQINEFYADSAKKRRNGNPPEKGLT